MKARNQRPQAGRQVVIVVDEREQQANQVDHVFVSHVKAPTRTAAHADPQQQLLKLLAELEVIGLVRGGHIALQMRQ
ncbi:hypothetical protein D3C79_558150 [compost metagenome]